MVYESHASFLRCNGYWSMMYFDRITPGAFQVIRVNSVVRRCRIGKITMKPKEFTGAAG